MQNFILPELRSANFRIADRTLFLDFKNAFKIAEKYHAEARSAEATSFNFAECKTWRCFLIDVRTFFDEKQFPFYRLDNVGDYTFSKYKVLWKEQSKQMTATVVSSLNDKYLGDKTVVTDSKVLYVSFDNKEEANYLCAVLNSRLIGKIIEAYTIDVQKGVDIVKNINIPKYNSKNKLHLELAELSIEAHEKYKTNNLKELLGIEERIENIVPKIFE